MGLIVCASLGACGGGGQGETEDTAPSEPVTPTAATVSLAWDASSGVTDYRLYYGTTAHTYQQVKGAGVAVGNVTAYEVSNLKGATRYYFAVTAVDSSGNESPYSNEVSKQMP